MSIDSPLPPSDNRIGIVGLGLMGTAITERFLQAGYEVLVWNRTKEKAQGLIAKGAKWSQCPLVECQRVIISLYSSDVVEEVLTGWKKQLSNSRIIIDTTTGDPQASVRFASMLAAHGSIYLEAPISGSSQQTRQGLATVIAAGDRSAFEACNDLWQLLGKDTFYVGSSGNAAKMKLVTNLVLGLNRAALAEGLAFAESLEIDLASALKVLQGSGAYSKQMDSKGSKMVAGDYSLQARLSQHLKDVRLILQNASESKLSLPLSQAHEKLLELAESHGLGELDNSAVFEALRPKSQP
ncbi:MAG: NAD(P)-dependent oxidoreductase [Planctomycetota bacterium]|jgi:3-hydroxyisobutyrate dehydrogenase-like beta-hydroxyacid dehydrogenase